MSTFFGTTNVCGVIPLTDYSPKIEGVVLSGDSSAVTITLFSKDYSLTSSVVTLDLTFRDPDWTKNTPLQISVELIEATCDVVPSSLTIESFEDTNFALLD